MWEEPQRQHLHRVVQGEGSVASQQPQPQPPGHGSTIVTIIVITEASTGEAGRSDMG